MPAAGKEGLVTLLELGPKARVCWAARVVEPEGFRRVGGILSVVGAGSWGVVRTVLAVVLLVYGRRDLQQIDG